MEVGGIEMTDRRVFLQIPGPTNVPPRILQAMNRPLVNHRGPEFEALIKECLAGLKKVLKTKSDVLIFPGSGSGGLEAAIVNTLSPGDKVLSVQHGVFSERFGSIAAAHGADVEKLEVEWGRAFDPGIVLERLAKDTHGSIKAVLVSHNETSTCVINDVGSIGRGMAELKHPGLLMVDAVSSLAMADLETDAWNIDIVISASQKGLMLPPGLAILSVSEKAWEAYKTAKMARWFWDFRRMVDAQKQGRVPYTIPTLLLFGLREALCMIEAEGLENVFARHARLARGVRAAVREMGLEVLPPEEEASPTVTGVKIPAGIEWASLNAALLEKGIVMGGGLAKLQGRIFRLGHMGWIFETELLGILSVLESGLAGLGYKVEAGSAVKGFTRATEI